MLAALSRSVLFCFRTTAAPLPLHVLDQRPDHAVEGPEEQQQIEAQLEEADLLVRGEIAEDFRCVEEVIVIHDAGLRRADGEIEVSARRKDNGLVGCTD